MVWGLAEQPEASRLNPMTDFYSLSATLHLISQVSTAVLVRAYMNGDRYRTTVRFSENRTRAACNGCC